MPDVDNLEMMIGCTLTLVAFLLAVAVTVLVMKML